MIAIQSIILLYTQFSDKRVKKSNKSKQDIQYYYFLFVLGPHLYVLRAYSCFCTQVLLISQAEGDKMGVNSNLVQPQENQVSYPI